MATEDAIKLGTTDSPEKNTRAGHRQRSAKSRPSSASFNYCCFAKFSMAGFVIANLLASSYKMSFKFKCGSCGEIHEGMPSFGAHAPISYYEIPEGERASRCDLGSDECVIDKQYFFVRGCIEIPVKGEAEPFSWGVWVSLSEASFIEWLKYYELDKRSQAGPFFGWLNAGLKPYPDTINLKTMVHLRDDGIRPYVELEPTDHPLAIEQRHGITIERVAELYSEMMHQTDK